ncbi:MAG TPA: protein kinase [Verrucomicrobiae bacterium]|nr:protein kinase [Verrucomicrobiae bacterium]
MANEKTCPHCGKPVPPAALGDLCPECMLKAGLATQTEGPGGTGPHGTRVIHPPPSPAEIASLFPQLEILECLGRGGMGVVYKARQPRLNRLVALKILAREKEQDTQFTERFTREAQALARLNHPNIVTVYDFGTVGQASSLSPSEKRDEKSETGATPVLQLHYLVMEFVDGLNLRQLLQAGKMPSEQALAIVPKICEALQYAHEQGVVHRDIKPENILLDKSGRVKIADFGIAKMMGDEPGQQTLTGAKDTVGTPHYMAPEQIEKPLTVDHRADIYSLGVVFYEMLTGELPLGKFQPPSKKVQIDVRLDEVVLHALEKEPERRYQQASEIKTQIETIAQATLVAGTTPNVAAFSQAVLARDYQLNIGYCLSRGWNLVMQNFWPVVGVVALIGLLQHAANSTLIGLVVGGPLSGGLWLYFLKKIRSGKADVGTAFSGFAVAFVPLFLGGLVTLLLVLAGLICLVLPGIYLAVAWAFTLMLIADKGLDFWPAMELSRRVISKHWWKFLWFFIVLGLIELAGLSVCLIGIFVAAPIAMAALAYAYEDIFGPAARAVGNAPAGAPATPRRSGGGWGTAVGVAVGVAAAGLFIAFLGLLTAIAIPNFIRARQHALALHEQQVAAKSDYIGQTWFPQGDSIEITSVERTKNQMTVKGHYNLVSHDNALLALYITTMNKIAVPVGPDERMQINKGNGDFELIDPHLVPGLPHVSMYGADGHPFASLYFGTKAEASEEGKAGWITNASSASVLQFRLVLPDHSRAPADELPSISGSNRFHLSRQVLLDDTAIARAGIDFNPLGRREIEIRFTDAGAKQFEAITATNIGHQLAIVFRGRVLSAPVIQSVIPGGECQVDCSMNASEVNEIVDYLNRTTTASDQTWKFAAPCERILPFRSRPEFLVGWLDLDSGTVMTNSRISWETRAGHEWIQNNSLDVVATESDQPFPVLLGIDMIIAPAPTNGWNNVTAADVVNNWTLLQEEPRQMQMFGAMPGQSDTFVFKTREGGQGILQILGFTHNPRGVKVHYKLVQVTAPGEDIDPTTGLPAIRHSTTVDPATGLPVATPGTTGNEIDPTTGLPITPNHTEIDPTTGLPISKARPAPPALESADLREARARLAELAVDFSPQNPAYLEQEARIQALEKEGKEHPDEPADLREARAKLAELRVDYSEEQPAVQEALARVKELERMTKEEPKASPELREAKAHLAELRVDYSENNPLVQQALAEVKVLEQSSAATTNSTRR